MPRGRVSVAGSAALSCDIAVADPQNACHWQESFRVPSAESKKEGPSRRPPLQRGRNSQSASDKPGAV